MHTFIVNDIASGALVRLSDLIALMKLEDIASWRFRDITLHGCGYPFGLTFDDFEAASRVKPGGFEVGDNEFRTFLESDFQILDGEIEAWSNHSPQYCVARFDCDDATQWEITTEQPDLAETLQQLGFQKLV